MIIRLIVSPILLALPFAVSFTLPPSSRQQAIHIPVNTAKQGGGGGGGKLSPQFSFSSWTSSSSSSLLSTISSNEVLLPGINAISNANDEIYAILDSIRESSYFRMYSVDILASCEYMPQELFECYSETCEVYPLDDDEVPGKIRDLDYREQEFEIDGWARWDMPSNDYYDLEEFPEGYTGYDGSTIWNYIHSKICFAGYGDGDDHWKADFNKAVSGAHSLVSVQVVQGIQDKIDTGEEFSDDEARWSDPRQEFDRRLGTGGETPLALENLYYTYMLCLSAAAKAKTKLLSECEAGMIDGESVTVIQDFLSHPILSDSSIQVAPQTLQDHAVKHVDAMWEARMRSRELLRIMNCVQCNKCRLHGKLAMMGLSTALQIHIAHVQGQDPNRINRVELAALMTTIHRLSKAINYCEGML